ncbi:Efflux pump [Penicillium hetheringtonii]|uniref:Efflux pump n=1 Tax=Penicillium hetheringtonii TaxID=911720 RepID=A0AAD6GUP6_9EURO|nr:Efflux pump [Penicillium hetheringtonii]
MGASEPSVTATEAIEGPEFNASRRFWAAFGSLLVVILASALDATSLSTALPIISRELGGTAIQAFWAGTSFLLTSTVFQLTFGSLSQIFGRKSLIISFPDPIYCAGGGGILSLTEVVITDLVPLRQRGTYFGYGGAVWALGSVTGPIMGGGLAQAASWRWIFWINLPICGIGFVMIVAFLNLKPVPGSLFAKIAKVDWVGALLLTASSTSLLLALSWGNVMYPWSSWRTIVPLILGVVGIFILVFYEAKVPHEPIVRLSIFKEKTALVTYLGTCIHGVVLWCLLYYLPLYYECVKGYSPIIAGVSVFLRHLPSLQPQLWLGFWYPNGAGFDGQSGLDGLCLTLGMGLMYLLGPDTSIPEWVFLNLIPGLGLGMLYNSQGYASQAAADEKDSAHAATMYTFSRSFGQSIGVAIGGAIFQSQFEVNLRSYPQLAAEATKLSQEASSLVEIVKSMQPSSPRRIMIVAAYADSLKVVWATMTGLAFLALLTSFFTRRLNVNRLLGSEQQLQEKKEDDDLGSA